MILRTISADLTRNIGKVADFTSLSFKVAMDDRLELATGEIARSPDTHTYRDLKEPNPDLFIEIYRESRGRAQIDKATGRVGAVHYTKAWDSAEEYVQSAVSFRLYLSDEDYAQLVDSVAHGVAPKTFSVWDIEGIRESGPEGSNKGWDNRTNPIVGIDNASWKFEIGGSAAPPSAAAPPAKPPSQAWGLWVFLVVVALVVGSFFRK